MVLSASMFVDVQALRRLWWSGCAVAFTVDADDVTLRWLAGLVALTFELSYQAVLYLGLYDGGMCACHPATSYRGPAGASHGPLTDH